MAALADDRLALSKSQRPQYPNPLSQTVKLHPTNDRDRENRMKVRVEMVQVAFRSTDKIEIQSAKIS